MELNVFKRLLVEEN